MPRDLTHYVASPHAVHSIVNQATLFFLYSLLRALHVHYAVSGKYNTYLHVSYQPVIALPYLHLRHITFRLDMDCPGGQNSLARLCGTINVRVMPMQALSKYASTSRPMLLRDKNAYMLHSAKMIHIQNQVNPQPSTISISWRTWLASSNHGSTHQQGETQSAYESTQ